VQAQTGLDDPAQRFQFLADGKPPLFNWVSMLFVWGGLKPLTAVRLVSVCAGLVTLSMVMLIARRLVGVAGTIFAGALYVLVPFFLVHDSFGLLDGLFTATAMTTLYLQIRLAESPQLGTGLLAGAALGAMMLTRQQGVAALVLLPASLLAFNWSAGERARRLARWLAFALAGVAVAGAIRATLLLSPLYDQFTHSSQTLHQFRPLGAALDDPFAYLHTNWSGFGSAFTGYVTGPLLAMLLVGIAVAVRRRSQLALLVLLWGLAPILIALLLVQFGFPRYLLSGIPPLIILAAYGAVNAAGFLRARLGPAQLRAAVASGAIVLMLPAILLDARVLASPSGTRYPSEDDFQYVAGWPAGTGLPDIARALDQLASPGTSVVAAVNYSPWNLATQFSHPTRIPLGGPIPFYDGITVEASRGRTIKFFAFGTGPSQGAQFVLQHDVFSLPPGLSLTGYHLVAAFTRPRGGTVQGHQQPRTTVQLYERNDAPPPG
jgi:hypothetical protein